MIHEILALAAHLPSGLNDPKSADGHYRRPIVPGGRSEVRATCAAGQPKERRRRARGVHGGAEMKLINLTPHTINLMDYNNNILLSIPSSGLARLVTTTERVGDAGGVPLNRTKFGPVTGLPEPATDTLYIVSGMICSALPERTDIASPGDLVRDAEGRVIGCRHLIVN